MTVREYLLKYIIELQSNNMTIEELVNDFCNTFCVTNGIPRTEEFENYITGVFQMYLNNEITQDELISALETVTNSNTGQQDNSSESSGSSSGGGGGRRSSKSSSKSSTETSKSVIDIDTDIIISLSEHLTSISEIVDSANISTAGVVDYAGNIETVVNNSKSNIKGALNATKEKMAAYLNFVEFVDENGRTITLETATFADLAKLAKEVKANGEVVLATEEFFKKLSENVDGMSVADNVVTLVKDGKTYKYNIVTHKFTVDDKVLENVRFYLPNVSTDYKKLNVFTYFQEGNSAAPKEAHAIGIEIKKRPDREGFNRYDPYYDQVAEVTKFMNIIVDSDKDTTHNIIAGDSKCGAVALKIAASSGKDVYDTVYCVDSAVIVAGENGNPNKKEQFASMDDLKGLNGKHIYLISVSNDGNLDHNGAGGATYASSSHKNSYAYTGYDLICSACPDSDIHIVYDEQAANAKSSLSDIPSLLKDTASRYNNCTYDANIWDEIAQSGYSHNDGDKLMNSLFASKITAYNMNTVNNATAGNLTANNEAPVTDDEVPAMDA